MKRQRNKNVIGARLHNIRREKKITQKEVCEKMQEIGLFLSQSALSKIESGERCVRDGEVLMLAYVLGVEVEELLGTVME